MFLEFVVSFSRTRYLVDHTRTPLSEKVKNLSSIYLYEYTSTNTAVLQIRTYCCSATAAYRSIRKCNDRLVINMDTKMRLHFRAGWPAVVLLLCEF